MRPAWMDLQTRNTFAIVRVATLVNTVKTVTVSTHNAKQLLIPKSSIKMFKFYGIISLS